MIEHQFLYADRPSSKDKPAAESSLLTRLQLSWAELLFLHLDRTFPQGDQHVAQLSLLIRLLLMIKVFLLTSFLNRHVELRLIAVEVEPDSSDFSGNNFQEAGHYCIYTDATLTNGFAT